MILRHGLLVYSYTTGTFGSRRIEQSTDGNVAVRLIAADTHPDHDTICAFRRENQGLVPESFVKILQDKTPGLRPSHDLDEPKSDQMPRLARLLAARWCQHSHAAKSSARFTRRENLKSDGLLPIKRRRGNH